MKAFKIVILIIIILLNSFIMSGCWNYKEIGDKAIITGAAVDYNKDTNRIVLTIEVATPKNQGQDTIIESEIFQDSGINVFDAARNVISKVGKVLFWSHAKVLILSEDLLNEKEKFIGVIDAFKRDVEIRDDIHVLVAKEGKARKLLQESDIEVESIKSFFIENIIKNDKSISKYHPKALWEFVDELSDDGMSSTLPTVHLVEYGGKKNIEILGTHVFKGEELVGWLDGIETKTLLTIVDELNGGIIVVDDKFNEESIRITLEIYDNKTKKTPQNNEELIIKIDIKTTVSIAEIGGEIDVIKEENREKLRKSAEELIKIRVEKLIKKAQEEYKSDIFGFGNTIKKEQPKIWKEVSGNWDEEFQALKTDVNVDFKIKGSALRSEPMKVSEQ